MDRVCVTRAPQLAFLGVIFPVDSETKPEQFSESVRCSLSLSGIPSPAGFPNASVRRTRQKPGGRRQTRADLGAHQPRELTASRRPRPLPEGNRFRQGVERSKTCPCPSAGIPCRRRPDEPGAPIAVVTWDNNPHLATGRVGQRVSRSAATQSGGTRSLVTHRRAAPAISSESSWPTERGAGPTLVSSAPRITAIRCSQLDRELPSSSA